MSLSDYVQVMRPAIEEALQRAVDESIPAQYPDLRAMLRYHMGWEGEGAGPEAQGKRIRPLLVLLAAAATREGIWREALPAAAAVELLHNFSLIHDDIQDSSPLRRNRPTLWVKVGVAQAINAGDIMFTQAFQTLQNLEATRPPQDVLEASRILQRTCLQLTQGQYLDISYEAKSVLPMEAYWPMIGGKTSALLGCCAELGALTCGADAAQRAGFREYGYTLGLAFQVLDDWLGLWGDVEQTGKSTESDLVSGKKTLPVLYALSKEGDFARRWMQGQIRPEEVPGLASLLQTEGAYAYTLETAEQLTVRSLNALHSVACDGPAAHALEELTGALLRRKN